MTAVNHGHRFNRHRPLSGPSLVRSIAPCDVRLMYRPQGKRTMCSLAYSIGLLLSVAIEGMLFAVFGARLQMRPSTRAQLLANRQGSTSGARVGGQLPHPRRQGSHCLGSLRRPQQRQIALHFGLVSLFDCAVHMSRGLHHQLRDIALRVSWAHRKISNEKGLEWYLCCLGLP